MAHGTGDTPLPSPCISLCQLDPVSGQCLGCFRTGDEIASWGAMSSKAQGKLLAKLRDRRAEMTGVRRRPTRRLTRR
ncbi:MAG: DUF1289 domain-containing protein [Bacteroidetes bacterium]|jgi:predicted Fe-S protein YdhL (DUF1289 family)|nr:DUF1289 domain-containing protein [Bacteroidota bacterium]